VVSGLSQRVQLLIASVQNPLWPPAGDSAAPTTAGEESAIGGRRVRSPRYRRYRLSIGC
jgi:hypothetical protein